MQHEAGFCGVYVLWLNMVGLNSSGEEEHGAGLRRGGGWLLHVGGSQVTLRAV